MVREGRAGAVGQGWGPPQGQAAERKRLKDSYDIHLILQCLSLVWTPRGVGEDLEKHTYADMCKHLEAFI